MDRIRVSDRLERLPITGYHRMVCGLLFLSWFCESIDLGGTSFLMPVIIEAFDMTTVQGGYYSSIAFFGMLVGSLVAGLLSDLLGRKKFVVISMICWGIAGMGMALAPNVAVLFTFRFILGLGLGAQLPVALAYLSEILPSQKRGKYISLYQMFLPFGIAFAGILTMLVLPHFGWRGVYVAEALPALCCILIGKFCPESAFWLESKSRLAKADAIVDMWEEKAQRYLKGEPLPAVVMREPLKQEKGKISDLFTKTYIPIIVLTFFYYFFTMLSDYGLTTWLTQLLTAKGFDVITSTGFVTVGILGGIPAFFFTSWAIEKLGRKWTFLITSVCAAVFAYFYGASNTVLMVILMGIFYQFGKYGLAMCTAVYTPELFDTHIRSTGTGLALAFGRLGSIVGPIILAWCMTNFGTEQTFYVAAVAALIPGLVVRFFGPETKGKVF